MDSFSWLFPQTSTQLTRIEQKVDTLMAQVQVAQEDLDALDQSLDQVAAELAAHIEALGTELPDADLSALQADVEALRALSAPAAEEPPA